LAKFVANSPASSLSGDPSFFPVVLDAEGRAFGTGIEGVAADTRDKWFVVTPPRVRLHPDLRRIVLDESRKRPDIDVFYGDEVASGTRNADHDIILKPEFNLALLAAEDYIGVPLIVRASAMHRLGGLRPQAGTAATYDLVLRALSAGLGVSRITEVLAVHIGARPKPDVGHRIEALRTWLGDAGSLFDITDGLAPGTVRLQRHFATYPDVSLVIPTRQSVHEASSTGQPFVLDLLDSLPRTDWPMDKLHVLVGDAMPDGSIYSGRHWPFHFRRVVTGSACNTRFNYAQKINELWRATATEQIVLINDDIVIESAGWLRALLTFSMQEDVGVVGARLLHPNGTIQHAGIPGGLFDLCAHAWLGEPASAPTYQNWALVHREWSMVTGAVLAIRRSLLEIVNGFDERFRLEFNDVDLSLRLRMLGYRNVYTPFAELIHFEKASRGELRPRGSELALFLKRWNEFLEQDPAYHPRLTRRSFQIAPAEQIDGWWQ
jgi:O-antigen biosynthesis protein